MVELVELVESVDRSPKLVEHLFYGVMRLMVLLAGMVTPAALGRMGILARQAPKLSLVPQLYPMPRPAPAEREALREQSAIQAPPVPMVAAFL